MDALTAVAWVDDRQVAHLTASKRWPDEGEAPGVDVRVRQLEATR
jgi:Holliday junction resolvase RusA-like endonuclease